MASSPAPTTNSTQVRSGPFLPIAVATLDADVPLHVDLYLVTQANKPPVLYRAANSPADRAEVMRLLTQGVHRVFIQATDYDRFQDHLRINLHSFLSDESRPLGTRMAFLAERSRDVLKLAFESSDTGKLLDNARTVTEDLVKLTNSHGLVPADLYAMLRHDYCTFAHSFRTSAYCVLLARACGITERETLAGVALGALLHDVGKLRLPAKVLSKSGPLNDVEKNLLSQHPQFGFERLCHREDLLVEQLMVVYQHHEQIDGRGYPVGLSGSEIHEWSRLTAVANAFDNGVSARPGHPGMSPSESLAMLQHHAGTKFDQEMVTCWTRCMMA